ncbi:MAG: NTP transferase domain-containing protein [Treponema sp.]|jgi:spore coat polysaccharide biosynthesis protein SpsF|nr:NTP transferase domain-containing protein [Treponema sp.]
MTAVVLQARLDSSRLPGKALLPLGGEPLILRVMEALKRVSCDLHVLACPEDCAEAFIPLAEKAGFQMSAGSKEDVLSRYCAAIRRFAIDRVIRATGDNPFVFADAAEALNQEALARNADYAGYGGLPHGAGIESVAAEALLHAEQGASLQTEREHVCPYLYHHPERFLLHRPLAPVIWQGPSLRITVDTREDYERAKALYEDLVQVEEPRRYWGEAVIKAYKRRFTGGRR